jgi:hypothetical protein
MREIFKYELIVVKPYCSEKMIESMVTQPFRFVTVDCIVGQIDEFVRFPGVPA